MSISVLQSFLLSRQSVEDNKVIRRSRSANMDTCTGAPHDMHRCSIETISRRRVKENDLHFAGGGGGGVGTSVNFGYVCAAKCLKP